MDRTKTLPSHTCLSFSKKKVKMQGSGLYHYLTQHNRHVPSVGPQRQSRAAHRRRNPEMIHRYGCRCATLSGRARAFVLSRRSLIWERWDHMDEGGHRPHSACTKKTQEGRECSRIHSHTSAQGLAPMLCVKAGTAASGLLALGKANPSSRQGDQEHHPCQRAAGKLQSLPQRLQAYRKASTASLWTRDPQISLGTKHNKPPGVSLAALHSRNHKHICPKDGKETTFPLLSCLNCKRPLLSQTALLFCSFFLCLSHVWDSKFEDGRVESEAHPSTSGTHSKEQARGRAKS